MDIISADWREGLNQMVMPYLYRVYTWSVRGQPTPAPRLTQARKYDVRLRQTTPSVDLARDLADDARAATITRGYYAFKEAVRAALLDAYPTETLFVSNCVGYGWPFRLPEGRSGALAVLEYALWMAKARTGNCVHGDPDNIAKAILDALFGQDRHVLPRCQSLICGDADPRVIVTVTLLDERTPPHVYTRLFGESRNRG
jgi:hypothetical protein